MMENISRGNMVGATAAAAGVLTVTTVAGAQTGQAVPQPQRPGRGGTDPRQRKLFRGLPNPHMHNPPSTEQRTQPNLRLSLSAAHRREWCGGWAPPGTVGVV